MASGHPFTVWSPFEANCVQLSCAWQSKATGLDISISWKFGINVAQVDSKALQEDGVFTKFFACRCVAGLVVGMWSAYALAMTGSATNLHSYSCFISCLRLVAVLLSSLVTFITLISGYPSYSSFAVVDTNDGSLQIYSGFLSTLFSARKHVPVKKCCVNVEQVLRPDLQPYAPHYQSVNLNYPLFQVFPSPCLVVSVFLFQAVSMT